VEDATLSIRSLKRRAARLFHGRFHGKFLWRSQEERAWLDMVPVGREFGRPDFERLMQQDLEELKSNLDSLVDQCSVNSSKPIDADFVQDALNVQSALHELGHDVSVAVAAAVWRHYSKALMASWLSGAQTVASAKRTLLAYCTTPWPLHGR
jgi:hypothetical protein